MAGSKWDWSKLGRQEVAVRWDLLTAWVAWLQETYEEWVKLPDCWARHEALRSELEFFRAWHAEVMDSGTPSEGTYWHSSLRNAAVAWAALSTCTHDEQPWVDDRPFQNATFQAHLLIARDAARSTPRPGA
jgi:hypothetical protein